MKKMTANQVYKLSGSDTPFSEWIGEQKKKYGDNFVENEEFINMAGATNFIGDNGPKSRQQVILENSDENISYPKGAGVSGSVSLGGTTASASAGVKGVKNLVWIVGGVVLAVWAYNRYVRK